jgi:MFS family permease
LEKGVLGGAREPHLQLLLLIVAAAADLYARQAVNPLQETMRVALALSDNQMALLQGPALALAPVATAIPLGILIDRYTRVRLLQMFALWNLAGTLLTACVSHFGTLFLARSLIGLAHTGTCTATFSLLADWYAPAQRGRTSMAVMLAQLAGTAAVFALGGRLATRYGFDPEGWRWAMLWLMVPLALALLLMVPMREPCQSAVPRESSSADRTFSLLWECRREIAPLLIGCVMLEISLSATLVWAAPALSRGFLLSAEQAGAVLSMAVLLSGVLGCLAGGFLTDWCQRHGGPRLTLRVLGGLALLSVPASLFALATRLGTASILLAALMIVASAGIVMALALLTIVTPSSLRGRCLAISIGANTLFGVALAPLAVSALSGALGGAARIGQALTLVCTVVGLLGAMMSTWGSRYFPRAEMR